MEIKGECRKDGFPVINIHGRWQCAAEYLDRCIGGETVINILEEDGVYYYLFENGHRLPLLCYCCGEPLKFDDLEGAKRKVVGLHLESMVYETVALEDVGDTPQLSLLLHNPIRVGSGLDVPVSFEVAEKMDHPTDCRHRPRPRVRKPKPR